MNLHYFQHVPFEGLGSMTEYLKVPGNKLTATRFYEDHKLPFVDICDALVVMGGPMGANDEHKYPWLTQEKKFIEATIKKGKKVIGVCLGAQLIADVLGARVYKNQEKEIGWFPVNFTPASSTVPLTASLPQSATVFHWHGDTFDLPEGSIHLASSEACANQAFLYNNQVLALQFHLEMTPLSLSELVENCREELLVKSTFVQDEAMILNNTEYLRSNNEMMKGLLSSFLSFGA